MKKDLLNTITICSVDEGDYIEPLGNAYYEEVIFEWFILEGFVTGLMWSALFAVDATPIAAGGVNGAEGSVTFFIDLAFGYVLRVSYKGG